MKTNGENKSINQINTHNNCESLWQRARLMAFTHGGLDHDTSKSVWDKVNIGAEGVVHFSVPDLVATCTQCPARLPLLEHCLEHCFCGEKSGKG